MCNFFFASEELCTALRNSASKTAHVNFRKKDFCIRKILQNAKLYGGLLTCAK